MCKVNSCNATFYCDQVLGCLSTTLEAITDTLKTVCHKIAELAKAAWDKIVAFGKKICPKTTTSKILHVVHTPPSRVFIAYSNGSTYGEWNGGSYFYSNCN